MCGFFTKIKEKLTGPSYDDLESEQGYVELDTENTEGSSKLTFRTFFLEDFEDVKPILDSMREGRTIALVNMRPLKDKDMVELKRAINKLKKTCDAIEGDIAGFGENWIAAVPNFAYIYRGPKAKAHPADTAKKAEGMEVTEYEE